MKIRYIFILVFTYCALNNGAMANSLEKMAGGINLFQQRTIYQQAVSAYKNKNFTAYQQLIKQLTNYPLYPYLISLSLTDSLPSLPYYEVDQFLLENNNTVIGRRLLENWLRVLADKKHWHDFRSYYSANIRSTRLQCLHLWARIKTSDKTAFKEVAALWDVKKSQPEACDPLFNEWIKQGYLTEDIVWRRYKKAITAKQYGLSRYLIRLAKTDKKDYFKLFKSIHNKPEIIKKTLLLDKNNNYTKDIIEHGLTRFQRKNPEAAIAHYRIFESRNIFSEDFKQVFLARNTKSEIRNLSFAELNQVANLSPIISNHSQSSDALLLKAVREQNWQFYLTWYDKLTFEEKNSDQWLYWFARALDATSTEDNKQSATVYQQLAKRRGYYGFLAADKLRQPYTLSDKPLTVDNNLLLEVNHIPAVARARELFFTNNIRAARREWRDGTQGFSVLAIQASAKLAHEWGWHRKAIEMLGSIKAWDHLAVRFPVIHQDLIEQKAEKFKYSPSLIFAIARQESAWQQDATSHAGARGLMQLIPSTAKDAAKKVGVRHKKSQLYTPEHNILLGSFHISELLDKYNNNRVPAIAAYNAGQHRVNQWMKKTNGKLPYDIWIETIPFSETRKYVKNVLYYSALYDYRSGNKINLLTSLEKSTPL